VTPTPTARAATLLEHAAELARLLLKSSQPPRQLTSTYLHGLKRLASDEREFVSSAAHHALRSWRFARACATGDTSDVELRPSPAETRAAVAAAVALSDSGFLPPFFALAAEHTAAASALLAREAKIPRIDVLRNAERWEEACASAIRAFDEDAAHATDAPIVRESDARLAVAVRWSLPDWVLRSWREDDPPLTFAFIARLGRALCASAPLTLRVNRLRVEREELLEALRADGVDAVPHAVLPDAAVVRERRSLTETSWYADGLFEVQDAGSQLITLACDVLPGWRVLDACAGGGGKTMHLADRMRDDGLIVACDIGRSKLRGLEERGKRLDLRSVRTAVVQSEEERGEGENAPESFPRFDCVLVDAPCSGFGTVRRHPALKWRLTEKTVRRLAGRQAAILAHYAEYVREGGVLLYATCSLLPQENGIVVRNFLEAHPDFTPAPLAPHFSAAGIVSKALRKNMYALLLPPDLLDSDGYFMARFHRRHEL
jgi:16S rRNA (cytosine967-C5)-methyltransferase